MTIFRLFEFACLCQRAHPRRELAPACHWPPRNLAEKGSITNEAFLSFELAKQWKGNLGSSLQFGWRSGTARGFAATPILTFLDFTSSRTR